MKLQLDERTLNLYLNKAINEEINELFGSKYNNQNKTGLGHLMIQLTNLESALTITENAVGIQSTFQNLASKIKIEGGGFDFKNTTRQNLLYAVEILNGFCDRVEVLEKKFNVNDLMEWIKKGKGVLSEQLILNVLEEASSWAAWEAHIIDAMNKGQAPLFKQLLKRASTAGPGHPSFAPQVNTFLKNLARTNSTWANIGRSALGNFGSAAAGAAGTAGAAGAASTAGAGAAGAAGTAGATSTAGSTLMLGAGNAAGAGAAGAAGTAGAGAAGTAGAAGAGAAGAAGTAGAGAAGGGAGGAVAGAAGSVAGGTIATAAAIVVAVILAAQFGLQASAQKKQRDLSRVYNCTMILAKRLRSVINHLMTNQQKAEVNESIWNGMNGKKAAALIPAIGDGMQELSQMMRAVISQYQTSGNQNNQTVQMPSQLKTSNDIRVFQSWANLHGYTDENGNKLKEDGIWGPHTDYAYGQIAAKQAQQASTAQQPQQTGATTGQPIQEAQSGHGWFNGKFDKALANLETRVRTTATGGAAYANTGEMFGNVTNTANRLQNSENGYQIAATYPKVLNQYLEKLHGLGIDTGTLEPLPIKTKASWFNGRIQYNVKDLVAIRTRIDELLELIGTAIDNGVKPEENITLPPKPQIQQPKPVSNTPAEPELPVLDNDIEIEDPEMDIPDMEPIDTSTPDVKTVSYAGSNGKIDVNKERNFVDNVIDVMRGMGSDDSASLKIKKMGMKSAYNNALVAIDKMVEGGALTRAQAKEEKKKLKFYYNQFRNGGRNAMWGNDARAAQEPVQEPVQGVVNEAMFKKLVKQIIRESFMDK